MHYRHRRTGTISILVAAAIAAAGGLGWELLATDTASAMPARAPQCQLADLTAQLTEPTTPPGQATQVRVIWINRSDHACTMDGYGGLDVVDAAGEHYPAARAAQNAPTSAPTTAPVELSPGMRAHSTLTYTAQGGTGTFTPVTVLATPPNETHSASLPWTAGALPTFPDPTNGPEISLSTVQPNVS